MILSVDPGAVAGWAYAYDSGELFACGVGRAPYFASIPRRASVLVIEKPHIGKGKASKGDIIKLARRMEKIIGQVDTDRIVEVGPSTWKGSVPKKIFTARILASATPAEMAILLRSSPKLNHNMVDAFGLLKYFFRVHRVRP